jgi:UDP-xylose/UDP-N-acetylglucosamine transporter B4
VWWFGNEWNAQLAIGAAMVFFGSLLYASDTAKDKEEKKKE